MFSLFRLIASDLRAKAAWSYESSSGKAVLKVLLTDGTPAMIWYRLMQWARRWHIGPLEMIFNRINTIFCDCIIGRGAEFGPGFVLIHSIGVVINGSVRGGANVKIEHQVTIGAERRQSPVIGNDVFIGAGAKVIGSFGPTWNSNPRRSRVAGIAASRPAASPNPTIRRFWPTTIPTICPGCAPSATRMPNSRDRCDTEYATMP